MFKTIFRKQFAMYIGNLLLIFLILGVVLTGMARNYFHQQKQKTLTAQSQRIAEGHLSTIFATRPFVIVEETPIEIHMLMLYNYFDASSFVCVFEEVLPGYENGLFSDARLRVLTSTANFHTWEYDMERVNGVINETLEFRRARYGQIVTVTGTMNGIFEERMMVVGYPIVHMGVTHGIVFMNSPIAEIEENIREFVNLVLLCLLLSIFIAFVLVYFSSRTISRPIRMISDVAKVIAAGNFDRRLTVKSLDEVGQLAESFNDMAESLANQENSRRAFISNISHDLRSPLTSVKGYIQAMLDGTIPQENRDKYLQVVLDETERVTKMANDLMFIGKFQNFGPDLDLSRFDINELVRTTLITFEGRIRDKNIQIEALLADEKNIVEADCEKIQRVIYNLIDNAVKFTGSDGLISVKTILDHPNPGKITVYIKDDGPGIPFDEQKKIFDRFYKSDQSRGLDKTGSGLGLAIVKDFIQAHGETMILNSAPGQGSEFGFTLTVV